jgi:hypothetical protein
MMRRWLRIGQFGAILAYGLLIMLLDLVLQRGRR